MKKHVLWALLGIVVIGLGAAGVAARDDEDYDEHHQVTIIDTYGAAPFVYGGYSYVPLKSAADFLGATLLWDSLRNSATIIYRDHQLALMVGSTTAYYGGDLVTLPAPPIIVGEQLLVPVIVFDRYFDVPVRWEPDDNRVVILGPPGWGYYQVLPYPPPNVIVILQGYGPPPWAPAYGRRRHGYAYYPQVYAPAPFVYYGVTYIPLRDVTDFIGAVLLWDSLRNRAVITYNGHEIGLVIGSPTVYYGPQVIVLPAPPIVVHDTVFVPMDLFERHMNIPIQRRDGVLKLKGPKGWREMRVAPTPPAQLASGGERERSHFGLPTQRPPEPGRTSGPWMRSEERRGRERRQRTGPSVGVERRPRPRPERGQRHEPWVKQEQAPPPKSAQPEKAGPQGKGGKSGGGWFKAKEKGKGKSD